LKQWIEIQQQLERILTKLSKDFDQPIQYHSLFQLEELSENLIINLNKHEHIEKLFVEARRIINSLDQLNQNNLMRNIEQYEIRWKDFRQRLNNKLEETSKNRFHFFVFFGDILDCLIFQKLFEIKQTILFKNVIYILKNLCNSLRH
jgi:hypothetical protein